MKDKLAFGNFLWFLEVGDFLTDDISEKYLVAKICDTHLIVIDLKEYSVLKMNIHLADEHYDIKKKYFYFTNFHRDLLKEKGYPLPDDN